jgi:hypothetical protein
MSHLPDPLDHPEWEVVFSRDILEEASVLVRAATKDHAIQAARAIASQYDLDWEPVGEVGVIEPVEVNQLTGDEEDD